MKVPRQVSLKHLAIIVISTILLTSFIFYVLAPTPSSTFWISGGIYPGAPSYTIFREGSNYFAKDSNGEIEFSGTNASEIILNSLGNWTTFITEGIYTINTEIPIPDHDVTIIGEGETTMLQAGGANRIFTITQMNRFRLEKVRLDGNYVGTEAIYSEDTSPHMGMMYLTDVCIRRFQYGVRLNRAGEIIFVNCRIETNSVFDLDLGQGDSSAHGSHIMTIRVAGNQFGSYGSYHQYLEVTNGSSHSPNIYGAWFEPTSEVANIFVGTNSYVDSMAIEQCIFHGGTTYAIFGNMSRDLMIVHPRFEFSPSYYINLTSNCHNTEIDWTVKYDADKIADSGVQTRYSGSNFQASGSHSGTTGFITSHGLGGTPESVTITPTTSAGNFSVSAVTATNFTIAFDGGGTVNFYWYAEYKP